MVIPVIYRDFKEDNIEFEPGAIGYDAATPGLVETTLDAEQKPIYAGVGGAADDSGFIMSQETFANWYRDVDGLNSPMNGSILLWKTDDGSYVNRYGANGEKWEYVPSYEQFCGIKALIEVEGLCGDCTAESLLPYFSHPTLVDCYLTGEGDYANYYGIFADIFDGNPLFFPIDNHPNPVSEERYTARVPDTYGGAWDADPSGIEHNFHFTSEMRFWFPYSEDRAYRLSFLGDDDIWVFLNGTLVIDIGGIHTPSEGIFTLSSANAVEYKIDDGGIYEIAVFQAERQTESSSFNIRLEGFENHRSNCVQ
jgi:fibro-slime domain-containing protein